MSKVKARDRAVSSSIIKIANLMCLSYQNFHSRSYINADNSISAKFVSYVLLLLEGLSMLSIEYTYKRSKLFRIELSHVVIVSFVALILVWQILSALKFFK